MLLQASIEIANAERWALEIGDRPAPSSLRQNLRRTAYEVTVVDIFHRVARRYFDRHGFRAVWEQPFHSGGRGRPESVDISLFDSAAGESTRLELGLYSKTKLKDDARKLEKLASNTLGAFRLVDNLLLLWDVREQRLTQATATAAMNTFKIDAATATAALSSGMTVAPVLSSSVDLFVAKSAGARHATVGLFSVT